MKATRLFNRGQRVGRRLKVGRECNCGCFSVIYSSTFRDDTVKRVVYNSIVVFRFSRNLICQSNNFGLSHSTDIVRPVPGIEFIVRL